MYLNARYSIGGCQIRTINELMLHRQLGVTACYIPVDLDVLSRRLRYRA